MSKVYEVAVGEQVQEVTTLKEVAALLGVPKVTGKELEEGKYEEVSIVKLAEVTEEAVVDMEELLQEQDEEINNPEVSYEDEVEENTEELTTKEEDTEDIEYPEVGYFKDEKAIKKYIKKLSDSQLQEWCELEGATWKPNDHEAINRMRMAMAIKAVHFPELNKPKAKKKSKYSQYSTEDLVQMALDNDVEVRDAKGDPRIERMYTIIALREAGLIS